MIKVLPAPPAVEVQVPVEVIVEKEVEVVVEKTVEVPVEVTVPVEVEVEKKVEVANSMTVPIVIAIACGILLLILINVYIYFCCHRNNKNKIEKLENEKADWAKKKKRRSNKVAVGAMPTSSEAEISQIKVEVSKEIDDSARIPLAAPTEQPVEIDYPTIKPVSSMVRYNLSHSESKHLEDSEEPETIIFSEKSRNEVEVEDIEEEYAEVIQEIGLEEKDENEEAADTKRSGQLTISKKMSDYNQSQKYLRSNKSRRRSASYEFIRR